MHWCNRGVWGCSWLNRVFPSEIFPTYMSKGFIFCASGTADTTIIKPGWSPRAILFAIMHDCMNMERCKQNIRGRCWKYTTNFALPPTFHCTRHITTVLTIYCSYIRTTASAWILMLAFENLIWKAFYCLIQQRRHFPDSPSQRARKPTVPKVHFEKKSVVRHTRKQITVFISPHRQLPRFHLYSCRI
jgi:hypothetical protein